MRQGRRFVPPSLVGGSWPAVVGVLRPRAGWIQRLFAGEVPGRAVGRGRSHRTGAVACAAAVLLAFVAAGKGLAAQDLRVTGGPVCTGCEIVVVDRVVLGERTDPVSTAGVAEVSVGADGTFYVVSRFLSSAGVLMYGEGGAFRGNLGGRGDGPGEFRLPWWVAIGGSGEVYVYDRGRFGFQVFGPDGEFLRTLRGVVSPEDPPVLIGDSLVAVLTGASRAPEAPDRPVHLYHTRSGDVVGGTGPRSELRADGGQQARGLSRSSGSDLWLVQPRPRGPSQRWTVDGHLRGTLAWDLDRDYWARVLGTGFEGIPADESEGVSYLWEDTARDVLWGIHILRDPAHEDPQVEPGQPAPPGYFDPAQMNSRYRSVVTALDLTRGQVIAHLALEAYVHGFVEDGRLITMGEAADGFQWVEIVDIDLVGFER